MGCFLPQLSPGHLYLLAPSSASHPEEVSNEGLWGRGGVSWPTMCCPCHHLRLSMVIHLFWSWSRERSLPGKAHVVTR